MCRWLAVKRACGCTCWVLTWSSIFAVNGALVQFKMISMSRKCPYALHPVSQTFPQRCLWNSPKCSSVWRWPFLVLSRKIVQRFLFPRFSSPGDRWCDVIGFVTAGSVSSSSTCQIFRDASQLLWLLCPPVCLLGHFPSLRHVQGSTPTGVFEGGCRPLTHSSLGFLFQF